MSDPRGATRCLDCKTAILDDHDLCESCQAAAWEARPAVTVTTKGRALLSLRELERRIELLHPAEVAWLAMQLSGIERTSRPRSEVQTA